MTRPPQSNTKAHRIAGQIRTDLLAGAFGDANVMPTEARLCDRYGASRETVRKALRLSMATGLLKRIPNRGVAIQGPPGGGRGTDRLQIAVITPYPFRSMNYYYHGILTGLVAGSHEMGVALTFIARTEGTDLPAITLGHPAIVWPAAPGDLPTLRRLRRAGRPFIVMSSSFADGTLPCVDCDNAMGVGQAIDCLFKHAHRRIGIVARSRQVSIDHAQRIAAARRRLRAHRLPVDSGLVFWPQAEWTPRAYDRAFSAWIRTHRITAVFTLDLEVAGRVYTFSETQPVAIPGQLSVVSFDDSELAEVYAPRITTVAQPLTEIGRRSVERLSDAASRRLPCRGTERLPTVLVERDSVAPPR